MDSVIYWIGILFKIVLAIALLRVLIWGVFWLIERLYGIAVSISGWSLFLPGFRSLMIKTANFEFHLNNLSLSVRIFDPTCRHFLKINVSGVHVEYYRKNSGDQRGRGNSEPERRPSPARTRNGPSLRKRVLYWWFSKLLRLFELSVKCLEVLVEDTLNSSTTLLAIFQVTDGIDIIAKPLPNNELGVSIDLGKAAGRYYLQADTPCPTTDDGLYTLGEVNLSTKILIFLRPLSPPGKSTLHSIQINTIPLTLTLLHEDLILHAVEHLLSFLPQSQEGGRSPPLEDAVVQEFLPEFEVVLEEVHLFYHASNRVLSSKLTRVSVAAKFPTSGQDQGRSKMLCFNSTIGVQGVTASDSRSRKSLTLKQVLLHIEKSSEILSNELQIRSLHASLFDGETVFWSKCIVSNLQRTVKKLKTILKSHSASNSYSMESASSSVAMESVSSSSVGGISSSLGSVSSLIRALPLSVVTTVEASDWSVQVRTESLAVQSKRPLVRGVMASCVGNIQWSPVQDHASSIRASLRLSDTYLHVPGFHPSINNPLFFQQRVDDPSTSPSLHQHLWGRVVSLGSLTLQVEKKLHIKQKHPDTITPGTVSDSESDELESLELDSDFDTKPLFLSGEARDWIFEWSKPTTVMLAKVFEHFKSEYGDTAHWLASLAPSSTSTSTSNISPSSNISTKHSVGRIVSVSLQFQLTNVNVFLYGLTPEPPALMVRLDAASFSIPPSPAPFHTLSLELHDLLLDDLNLPSWDKPFFCSPVSDLPRGVGVALFNTIALEYDHQIKNVEVDVGEVMVHWTTTVHCSLFHMLSCLREDVRLLQGVVMSSAPPPSPPPPPEVVVVGDRAKQLLETAPFSLTVDFNVVEATANLDKRTGVSVRFKKSQVALNGGTLCGHSQQLSVQFDQHRIIQVHQFLSRFPHPPLVLEGEGEGEGEGDGVQGRRKFRGKMSQEENQILGIQISRLELLFPCDYNFSQTFDKVISVKKFLQNFHATTPTADSVKRPLLLAPDFLVEWDSFLLQVCDNPFESKLRTNYELLCDEYVEKTERVRALKQKIEQVKKLHGEYSVSGLDVQNFYDSLDVKDSEIYCQRAKKLYESTGPLQNTSLFQFSMSGTKILAMSDPSMLKREGLVECIQEMDSISPLPDGNYEFSTLWGGYVDGKAQNVSLQVRDYPWPPVDISQVTISGRMVFAEQEAQEREKRLVVVEVGRPWKDVTVQRKLPPLKYFYDFEMTSSTWSMTYGPCMEPGLAQTNNSFGLLTTATVDPSQPLAYWDKLRLLFHGTIHLRTEEMKLILPTTFNPYNSVEYLELRMTDLDVSLLTNTKLTLEGAVQLLVHTASKYDECELLTFPHASASISVGWVCAGKDPNRHHHVVRCAPDRLPVRPDKQEHDSYGSFRSQNVDLCIELTVHPPTTQVATPPSVLLYSSTLRCLQQYQMLLKWNVSRPVKRGKLYNNVRAWPRRPPVLRHCRNVKLAVSLPKTVFRYWSSRALQRGVETSLEKAELKLSLSLALVPMDSDLTRRHGANWTVTSLSGRGEGIRAFIKRSTEPQDSTEAEDCSTKIVDDFVFVELGKDQEHSTSTLLSIEKITYSRSETSSKEEYTHKLEATNTHVLWSSSNRNVVLGLYDAFKQAQELKRYLSTEALKSILSKNDLCQNDLDSECEGVSNASSSPALGSPKPSAHPRHSSSGNTMLDLLLSDINNTYVEYVDERAPSDPQLKGIQAVNIDDVIGCNWLIILTNIQVVLQGMEHWGYVVASSHQASIFGRDHNPKMKNGVYVSKTSWEGKVQELQYFTTQSGREEFDHVPWLPLSVIRPPGIRPPGVPIDDRSEKRHLDSEANLNALLGTLGPSKGTRPATPMGEAMGGTVSSVRLPDVSEGGGGEGERGGEGEGEGERSKHTVQLQRVAPRCHCQVIYVTYGDQVEAEISRTASPGGASPRGGALNSKNDVDTFTFRYPSVEVCTTSYQYALMMDIINNLLLSKELKRKEAMDHHARMQFSMQLSSNIKEPRAAVLNQQNKVKKCLQAVHKAETALFLEKRDNPVGGPLEEQLEARLAQAKEELTAAGMKLSILVKTFRQSQLYLAPTRAANITVPSDPTRRIEIWVDDAHWSVMDSDGQLQLADICLTHFSYNRLTFSDDSGEHKLELGTFRVQNLLPNTSSIYQQVLSPYDPKEKHLRVDKNVTLRVYCKDKAPVAGISVKEHLEVNVVPLNVSLTFRFYQTMQDFFFPKAEETLDVGGPDHSHIFGPTGVQPSPHYGDAPDGNSPLLSRATSRKSIISSSSSTNFAPVSTSVSPPQSPSFSRKRRNDDVEKMKDRATTTKTFIYIKIPQTTLCITYKNENNVSFKDLQNQRVIVPTLEYHNRNWTWTDMLMELKKDYRSAIVQQTLKSAIGMRGSDEMAGLVSPKTKRHSTPGDIILFNPQVTQKSGKSKRLLGRLGSSRDSEHEDQNVSPSSSPSSSPYLPPLTEQDSSHDLKRTMRSRKVSQNTLK